MPRATHFVAFPLWSSAAAVERVRGLLASLELPLEPSKRHGKRDPSLASAEPATPHPRPSPVPLVAAESIHLTLGVFELGDRLGDADAPRSLARATEVLTSVAAELRELSRGLPHQLVLGHPGHFPEEARRERARVVYLRPDSSPNQPTTILDMALLVHERLKEAGLFAGQRQNLKLHCTLAKSSPQARFDSTALYDHHGDFSTDAHVDRVAICRIGSWDRNRLAYKIEREFRFA